MQWVVMGLGNPTEEYAGTRHNAGRMAVELFAKRANATDWRADKKSQSEVADASVGKEDLTLVLPNTYMNKSGAAVGRFVKSAKAAERLIVLYDDLDLPVGRIKLSFDRGSGGHKGIESIIRAVKTKKFTRVRIGVSPHTPSGKLKKPQGEREVERFILGKFKAGELEELKKVFKTAGEAIETIVGEGREIAMTRFN